MEALRNFTFWLLLFGLVGVYSEKIKDLRKSAGPALHETKFDVSKGDVIPAVPILKTRRLEPTVHRSNIATPRVPAQQEPIRDRARPVNDRDREAAARARENRGRGRGNRFLS